MKQQLRLKAKSILKQLTARDIETLSKKLSHNLITYLKDLKSDPQFSGQLILGGFAPIHHEPIWFSSWEEGIIDILSVPHIKSETDMAYFQVELDDLANGKLELTLASEYLVKQVVPTVVLVPGLFFDDKMNRLGRGKGYFDRYLQDLKALKIGVCFECQLSDKLMAEDHDEKVDLLITEENIYNRG